MPNQVDNRVVQMTFDNQRFEKNVATSMSTIEKLKESLNFEGVGKGIGEIEKATKGIDFSSVGEAVDTIQAKFSAMQIVAMTAISNITNSVINLGKKMVSSIIQPIATGGWNRAMNIENAKFQLEGLGVEWDEIEEDINWGVKSTAYGLDSAAKAAAQLVASQVELGTEMKAALRGISGVAAMTNSEYDDIARIFTTVAGNGRLMGDQLLQISSRGLNAASTIADYFNKVTNNEIEATQSVVDKVAEITGGLKVTEADIRDFVSKGKIDFEVFATAMDSSFGQHAKDANNTFSGALSNIKAALARIGQGFATPFIQNMVKVFNSIIPLIDNIKKHLQPVFDVVGEKMEHFAGRIVEFFDKTNEKVSEMFTSTNMARHISQIVDLVERLYDLAKRYINPIKEAFSKVFVIDTSFSKWLDDLLRDFRLALNNADAIDSSIDRVTRTFSGLFAVLDIAKQLLGALYENILKPVISSFFNFGDGVLTASASLGDWLTSLAETLRENDTFNKVIGGTVAWFKELKDTVTGSKLFQDIVTWMGNFVENVKALFETIKNSDLIQSFKDKLDMLVSKAKEKFETPGFSGLRDILDKLAPVFEKVHDIASKAFGVIGEGLKKIWEKIKEFNISDAIVKIWEAFKYVFENLGTVIGNFVKQLNDALGGTSGLQNIVKVLGTIGLGFAGLAGGKLGGSLSKFFDSITGAGGEINTLKLLLPDLNNAIITFKNNFKVFAGSLKSVMKFSVAIRSFKTIATAILELAAALFIIASIDEKRLNGALLAITGLFADLIGSIEVLKKTGGAAFSGTGEIVKLAGAVFILAEAMKAIGSLEERQLQLSFIAITGLIAEMVGVSIILGEIEKPVTKGTGVLISFATAIRILASAMKAVADLDWDQIVKGLVAIGGLMLELAAFMAIISKIDTGNITSTAFALIEIGVAVKILADVVKTLGKLDYESLAKGLIGVGVVLVELALFLKIVKDTSPDNMVSVGLGLIELSVAMKIFASAVGDFGKLSWEELVKGLAGLAVVLATVTIALNNMPDNMIAIGTGLTIVSIALKLIESSFMGFASLDLSQLMIGLVGMAGSLTALAVALNAMNNAKQGAIAMTIASAAMVVFVPAFKSLASLSWSGVIKGLTGMAGALTIFAVAANVLAPMSVQMIITAKAIGVMSLSMMGVGAAMILVGTGLTAISAGITSAAASFEASLAIIILSIKTIVVGIIELIPAIIGALKDVVVSILDFIIETVPTFGRALVTVVTTLVDVLVQCIPMIVGGIWQLILGVLKAAVEYIPQIVEAVSNLIIGVFDSLANKIPELVKSALNLIGVIFNEIAKGITAMNPDTFRDVLINVGIISGLIVVLAEILPFVPAAMAGVLAVGAVIAELSRVLAAVGELSAYVGGIEAAGDVLQAIGTAIGQFIGGIAGGVAEGFTSALPQIGQDLSDFMTNLSGFITGVQGIDESVATGVKSLATAILVLTAAEVIDGIASFLPGSKKTSMEDFGKQISEFGKYFAEYAVAVEDVKPEVVTASAAAAESLAEFARKIPNKGGLISKIVGDNNLRDFASQLRSFGKVFAEYYVDIKDVRPQVVKATSSAAESIAAFAKGLPNQGGFVSWFTGDNKLGDFAPQLKSFGEAFGEYYKEIAGVKPHVVKATSSAAESIAAFAEKLPNQGGVVSWFAGDNTLAKFAVGLKEFGTAFKDYYTEISDVEPDVVIASVAAAESIASFADKIPNTGGLKDLFTGDNSLYIFGKQLAAFGPKFKEYSDSIGGIRPDLVRASGTAGAALADFVSSLPETGGIESWFNGGTMSLSKFGEELAAFGPHLTAYSKSILLFSESKVEHSMNAVNMLSDFAKNLPSDLTTIEKWFGGGTISLSKFGEELEAFGPHLTAYSKSILLFSESKVEHSMNAIYMLRDFASALPSDQTVFEKWFGTGTISLSKFGEELEAFGPHLAAYSKSILLFSESKVEHSMNAVTMLADFAKNLPPDNSNVKSWITGGTVSLSKFGEELAAFGPKITAYSTELTGFQASAVESSMRACRMLVDFAGNLPDNKGLGPWLTGYASLSKFGAELAKFGPHLQTYSVNIAGVDSQKVTESANAALVLARFADTLPENTGFVPWITGSASLSKFGAELSAFATYLVTYSNEVKNVDYSKLTDARLQVSALVRIAKDVASIDAGTLITFGASFAKIGETGVDEFITAFTGATDKVNTAVESFMSGMVLSLTENGTVVPETLAQIVEDSLEALNTVLPSFQSKGAAIINGLSEGLTKKQTYFVTTFDTIMDAVLSAADTKNAAFITDGNNYIDSLRLGMKNGTADLMLTFKILMTGLLDTKVDYADKFSTFGKSMVSSMMGGMTAGSDGYSLASIFTSAVSDAVALIKAKYTDFYNAGYYIVKGFYNGVYDYKWLARQAGVMIGKAAFESGLESYSKINSPSKKAYDDGYYTIIAYVNAISDNLSLATKAGKEMATSAESGFNAAMSRIAWAIDSDIDLNPTITPVLDLSQIQNGVDSMNYMLGRGNYAIDGTVDAAVMAEQGVANSINNSNQIMYAILDLKKTLENLEPSVVNNYENQFNINADDPQATAEAVGDIFQHDIDRGGAVWA